MDVSLNMVAIWRSVTTATFASVSWAVWIPIIVATFIAVFGVVKWLIEQRQLRQARAQAAVDIERRRADDYCTNVLRPLSFRFEVSGDLSRSLLIEPSFAVETP